MKQFKRHELIPLSKHQKLRIDKYKNRTVLDRRVVIPNDTQVPITSVSEPYIAISSTDAAFALGLRKRERGRPKQASTGVWTALPATWRDIERKQRTVYIKNALQSMLVSDQLPQNDHVGPNTVRCRVSMTKDQIDTLSRHEHHSGQSRAAVLRRFILAEVSP